MRRWRRMGRRCPWRDLKMSLTSVPDTSNLVRCLGRDRDKSRRYTEKGRKVTKKSKNSTWL